ncbi:voltage-gated ion channel superfamily, partial [Reticulomyxa filosa]
IRVPYAIAFDISLEDYRTVWFVSDRSVDIIFGMDMLLMFITAIPNGRMLIIKKKEIAWIYAKGWFIPDLIATVPIDLLVMFCTNSRQINLERSAKLLRIAKSARLFRVMRLLRLKRVLIELEILLGLSFSILNIVKFAMLIIALVHLLACGYLAVARANVNDSWIYTLSLTHNLETRKDEYIAALYWALQTMITIGYGDVPPVRMEERIFAIVCMIIGGFLFTYGLTRIVNLVSTLNQNDTHLISVLDSINDWAHYYKLPNQLTQDIRAYIYFQSHHRYVAEKEVFNSLSDSIKRKVQGITFGPLIQNIAFFHGVSDAFFSLR